MLDMAAVKLRSLPINRKSDLTEKERRELRSLVDCLVDYWFGG